MGRGFLDFVDDGDEESPRLACPILRPRDDTAPTTDQRNAFLLNGGGRSVAGLGQSQDEFLLELEGCEVFVLEGLDVLSGQGATLVCSRRPGMTSLSPVSESLSII